MASLSLHGDTRQTLYGACPRRGQEMEDLLNCEGRSVSLAPDSSQLRCLVPSSNPGAAAAAVAGERGLWPLSALSALALALKPVGFQEILGHTPETTLAPRTTNNIIFRWG